MTEMTSYKKPSLDEFEEALSKCGGNLTTTASMLNVKRQTIHNWMRDDEEFKSAVDNSRKRMFDKCLDVARIVALGVPRYDKKSGEFIGWIEKPDSMMLRYLLSTLGRDEGFGDRTELAIGDKDGLPTTIKIVTEVAKGKDE